MVRPGVEVDEDWEIHLHDEYEDDAWEADDSRKKRYYVGRCAFEERDPVTGRNTSFRIFSGRIRLPEKPVRFRAAPRSPIRVVSFSVTSPSEAESDPSEFVESVDSRSVPEPNPEAEDVDVVMTEEDVALNATIFLADICEEAGKLKKEIAEEAKDWMERYLRKKRGKCLVWVGSVLSL